jgi:hypothetical protein
MGTYQKRYNNKIWLNVRASVEKDVPGEKAGEILEQVLDAADFLASGQLVTDDPGEVTTGQVSWCKLPDVLQTLSLEPCTKVFLFLAMFACGDFPQALENKERGSWGTLNPRIGSQDKE